MVDFYIGATPSLAASVSGMDCAGAMVSVNTLWKRKSDFAVGQWILDSGAFTEVARHGGYRYDVQHYWKQIERWRRCGYLLAAVAQDYMCEPFVIQKTGLTVADHIRLTIERYDQLLALADGQTYIMPVIQGYTVADYLDCLSAYGDRLPLGAWVGVGSVCRRNGDPAAVADILAALLAVRPDLRFHGFGLKKTALGHHRVSALLYSCDSFAWSVARQYSDVPLSAIDAMSGYVDRLSAVRRVPATAGAGNGQGRKAKWKNGPTVAVRIPAVFVDRLMLLAREWDSTSWD